MFIFYLAILIFLTMLNVLILVELMAGRIILLIDSNYHSKDLYLNDRYF